MSFTIKSKITYSAVTLVFDNLCKLALNYSKSRGYYKSILAAEHSFIRYLQTQNYFLETYNCKKMELTLVLSERHRTTLFCQ